VKKQQSKFIYYFYDLQCFNKWSLRTISLYAKRSMLSRSGDRMYNELKF